MKTLGEYPGCASACRGCHYRDLTYDKQLVKKNAWAQIQLSQWIHLLAPIKEAPLNERTHYRSKSWLRSSCGEAGNDETRNLSFGMFRSKRKVNELGKTRWIPEFINWNYCPIHRLAITESLERLRAIFSKSATEVFISQSLVGIWTGLPDWVIVSRKNEEEYLKSIPWDSICSPQIERVFAHTNKQAGNKIWGHLPLVPLYDRKLNNQYKPPPGVFRQVAQTLLNEARSSAVRFLIQDSPVLILDLFCGTGELVNLLPKNTRWMGIEQSKKAVQFFNSFWENQTQYQAYTGSIEARLRDPKIINQVSENYNIYINPPRSGISVEGIELLKKLIKNDPPKRIAYLSCSASSLKRNLIELEHVGFSPIHLQPYDFFPQTEHFETLALLKRY